MGSRTAIELQVDSGGVLHDLFNLCCLLRRQPRGGGESVRRRNALHEVGGRVPEVPRVRNARAGSETHTHIIFSLTNYFSHKIKS